MDSFISHPADAADELQRLSIEEAREPLAGLPSEHAAAILIELNRELWPRSLSPLLNGLSIGLLVGVINSWWNGSVLLGVVVGLAMMLNMIAAALSGVLLPDTLKALRIDPALASSI